jgi:hypothetical protein
VPHAWSPRVPHAWSLRVARVRAVISLFFTPMDAAFSLSDTWRSWSHFMLLIECLFLANLLLTLRRAMWQVRWLCQPLTSCLTSVHTLTPRATRSQATTLTARAHHIDSPHRRPRLRHRATRSQATTLNADMLTTLQPSPPPPPRLRRCNATHTARPHPRLFAACARDTALALTLASPCGVCTWRTRVTSPLPLHVSGRHRQRAQAHLAAVHGVGMVPC